MLLSDNHFGRFIGKVLERMTVDEIGDTCWLYLRTLDHGGSTLACEKPRIKCATGDVEEFLLRVSRWIEQTSTREFQGQMLDFNDETGVFESIRFLFLIDDMRTNSPTTIRVSKGSWTVCFE